MALIAALVTVPIALLIASVSAQEPKCSGSDFVDFLEADVPGTDEKIQFDFILKDNVNPDEDYGDGAAFEIDCPFGKTMVSGFATLIQVADCSALSLRPTLPVTTCSSAWAAKSRRTTYLSSTTVWTSSTAAPPSSSTTGSLRAMSWTKRS